MTGGAESFRTIEGKCHHSCATCGCSLDGRRSNALTCSDRCRKIKNGQTRLRRIPYSCTFPETDSL